MDERLLNLPWEVQLALAAGYVAYLLAYVGIREHHRAADVTFRAIAFGLFATAVLLIIPSHFNVLRVGAALLAPLAAGIVWRLWLSDAMLWVTRQTNLSWSDDTPSAWFRVTQHNRKIFYSQLSVELIDGSFLHCAETWKFADAPFGPCTLGPGGDVAMYVTHSAPPNKEMQEMADVRDAFHGDLLTYVPAAQVRKVRMRLIRRPTATVAEVAEPLTEVVGAP